MEQRSKCKCYNYKTLKENISHHDLGLFLRHNKKAQTTGEKKTPINLTSSKLKMFVLHRTPSKK